MARDIVALPRLTPDATLDGLLLPESLYRAHLAMLRMIGSRGYVLALELADDTAWPWEAWKAARQCRHVEEVELPRSRGPEIQWTRYRLTAFGRTYVEQRAQYRTDRYSSEAGA